MRSGQGHLAQQGREGTLAVQAALLLAWEAWVPCQPGQASACREEGSVSTALEADELAYSQEWNHESSACLC